MENLDDMIKKYSEALEEMGKTYGGEAAVKIAEKSSVSENETLSEGTASYSAEEENTAKEAETAEITLENDLAEEEETVDTEPSVQEGVAEPSEADITSTALFSAAVFAGEGTYPVEGARIVVYRDDNIYAFLESDANGATKKVTLPAFPEENSLDSENPDRSIDYFADVFAEGFKAQKGLLVSSVGGSDIFLRVLMVPEEERLG